MGGYALSHISPESPTMARPLRIAAFPAWLALALWATVPSTQAQGLGSWPDKPIRLIVPYTPAEVAASLAGRSKVWGEVAKRIKFTLE